MLEHGILFPVNVDMFLHNYPWVKQNNNELNSSLQRLFD